MTVLGRITPYDDIPVDFDFRPSASLYSLKLYTICILGYFSPHIHIILDN